MEHLMTPESVLVTRRLMRVRKASRKGLVGRGNARSMTPRRSLRRRGNARSTTPRRGLGGRSNSRTSRVPYVLFVAPYFKEAIP